MFGTILKLQALLEKLKKNKALWFNTLTALSIVGILGTLYYLNSMTTRAAKNLYESTNASYFYDLEMKINDTTQKLMLAGSFSIQNQTVAATLSNAGNGAAITALLKKTAENMGVISKSEVVIDFYSKDLKKIASSLDGVIAVDRQYDSKILQKAVASNEPVSGVEYKDGHTYLTAAFPIGVGVLEFKKNTDFLFDAYETNGKIFQVLLDKDFLDMKRVQEFRYQPVGKSEISVQARTDGDFLQKSAEVDFVKVVEQKYVLTDEYFILAKPILNPDGKRVGVFVIAERIMQDNSLPKMVKGISTGLTTAALGLVVALLVLMI